MTLTLYLGLLGMLGFGILVLAVNLNANGVRSDAAQVGANLFQGLALIQISLISLLAPALARGDQRGRERQTLDVLLVSRVSPLGIVWGKLVASVAFMLLLILAALPLFAAVFLFGGIDAERVPVTQLLSLPPRSAWVPCHCC